MEIKLKTLILDSLMAHNIAPDIMYKITAELVERITEIASPRVDLTTYAKINMLELEERN